MLNTFSVVNTLWGWMHSRSPWCWIPSRYSTPHEDELEKPIHSWRVFQEIIRLENPGGKVVPGRKVVSGRIISKDTFGTYSFHLQGYLWLILAFHVPSISSASDSISSLRASTIATLPCLSPTEVHSPNFGGPSATFWKLSLALRKL